MFCSLQDYIFLSDQLYQSMRVYSKSTHESLTSLLLGEGNVPYDVMMYASGIQDTSIPCKDNSLLLL